MESRRLYARVARSRNVIGVASLPFSARFAVCALRRVLFAVPSARLRRAVAGYFYLAASRRWGTARHSMIGIAACGIRDAHTVHRQSASSSNTLKRCMVFVAPTAPGELPAVARERTARIGARLVSNRCSARSGVLIFTAKVSHRHCFFASEPRRRMLSEA